MISLHLREISRGSICMSKTFREWNIEQGWLVPPSVMDFVPADHVAVGFDLCPRLKALSDRHLFLPKGSDVPEAVRAIAQVDAAKCVGAHNLQPLRTTVSGHQREAFHTWWKSEGSSKQKRMQQAKKNKGRGKSGR